VGIISLFVSWLLSMIIPGPRWVHVRVLITIFFIVLFAAITSFSPSVLRAAIMFSLFLCSRLFSKRFRSSINSLCMAGVGILLVDPFSLFDIGFQYSFSAVLGILIASKPLESIFPVSSRFSRFWLSIIIMSLCAQIMILPWSLYYFGEVSTVSILSSLVAIPMATVIMVSSIFIILFDFISPIIAGALADILSTILNIFFEVMRWFSDLPYSVYSLNEFDECMLWLFFILVGIVLLFLCVVSRSEHMQVISISPSKIMIGILVLTSAMSTYHSYASHITGKEVLLVVHNGEFSTEYEVWSRDYRYSASEEYHDWRLDKYAEYLELKSRKLISDQVILRADQFELLLDQSKCEINGIPCNQFISDDNNTIDLMHKEENLNIYRL